MSSLSLLLSRLTIPSDFARYEAVSDPKVISELELWKDAASRVLSEVKNLLDEKISIQEHANVVSAVAPFTAADTWVTPESKIVSSDILHQLPEPDGQLLEHILIHNVKPLFVSSPHPHLNLSTGRRLARPAGGPMNTQDFFEGQTWKEHPGTAEVVLYVVQNLKASEYEGVWHLVIPPVMTLLDDYQGLYKLRGVQIVAVMLGNVPGQLLKRTGVDSLLIQSLSTCMGLIRDPESPDLLRTSIAAWLTLTTKTTDVGSAEQFDRLSVLLGEHIIGSVWLYGSAIAPVILATVEALPPVVRQLGIGSARFLKALMYQLLYPLQQNSADTEMQLRSIDALLVVMKECAPRISHWSGAILNAVARCFVTMQEDGMKHDWCLSSLST
ncbi:hypothetical protein CPB85DRAFT_1282415 [Mucidula mucida]|nr:hypothetical protein CPB85DRAFT_1282415 [Mucidula mucida]